MSNIPFFSQPAIKAKLEQLCGGTLPLKELFWLYFFIPAFVLGALAGLNGFLGVIFALAGLGWCAYMARPVIVAADHYQGEKHWAILTKIAVVLILLSALFQLFA